MTDSKLPFERQCPSKYPCPFKRFSMAGMECVRDDYPHLIVFCCLKEGKHFMSEKEFAKLEKKMGGIHDTGSQNRL